MNSWAHAKCVFLPRKAAYLLCVLKAIAHHTIYRKMKLTQRLLGMDVRWIALARAHTHTHAD